MLQYRPEIDGLRALAVLPVILYHANVAGLEGGFVGVDVFFVISGYLISCIILQELRQGRFSLASFYERRVRRIFPALFAMLIATWLAGYALLLPGELKPLSSSLWQATLFSSNIGFAGQSGYFEPSAETKPLLHTWSLCVEEQFYLLLPLLLIALWRWLPRRLLIVLSLLLLSSLLLAVRAVTLAPESAFYLAHLRAWELLLGSVVALSALPAPRNRVFATTLSLSGLLAVLAAVFGYSRSMAFPGLAALLPTLGAAAFLYAESHALTPVGKIIAHRALVSIGLISYALYLWHWPALVYARMLTARALEPWQLTIVLLTTLALAVASRTFLEEPFRKRQVLTSRAAVFGFAAALMAATCAVAIVTVKRGGLPGRIPQLARTLLAVGSNPGAAQVQSCIPGTEQNAGHAGVVHCDVGAPTAPAKTFLMWGDSHAQSLTPAANLAAQQRGLRGTVITRGGCPPAVGLHLANRPDQCSRFHRHVMDLLDTSPDYQSVILVGRWGAWLEPRRYQGTAPVTIQNGGETGSTFVDGVRLFERGLHTTLSFLQKKGKRVSIVGPVPEAETSVPRALARSSWRQLGLDVRPNSAEVHARQRPFDAMIARLRQTYNFALVQPADVLCKNSHCQVTYRGKSLYFDDQHLIGTSAPLLAPLLSPLL